MSYCEVIESRDTSNAAVSAAIIAPFFIFPHPSGRARSTRETGTRRVHHGKLRCRLKRNRALPRGCGDASFA
jgi:hypothetical protein